MQHLLLTAFPNKMHGVYPIFQLPGAFQQLFQLYIRTPIYKNYI